MQSEYQSPFLEDIQWGELRQLSLQFWLLKELNEQTIVNVVKSQCRKLQSLSFSFVFDSPEQNPNPLNTYTLLDLAHFTDLRHLNFHYEMLNTVDEPSVDIDDDAVTSVLHHLPHLKSLHLSSCMGDDAFRLLPKALPYLEHFGCTATMLKDPRALAEMVASLRHLRSLDISNMFQANLERMKWSEAAPNVEVFLGHPTLKELKYLVGWITSPEVAAKFMTKFGQPAMHSIDATEGTE